MSRRRVFPALHSHCCLKTRALRDCRRVVNKRFDFYAYPLPAAAELLYQLLSVWCHVAQVQDTCVESDWTAVCRFMQPAAGGTGGDGGGGVAFLARTTSGDSERRSVGIVALAQEKQL